MQSTIHPNVAEQTPSVIKVLYEELRKGAQHLAVRIVAENASYFDELEQKYKALNILPPEDLPLKGWLRSCDENCYNSFLTFARTYPHLHSAWDGQKNCLMDSIMFVEVELENCFFTPNAAYSKTTVELLLQDRARQSDVQFPDDILSIVKNLNCVSNLDRPGVLLSPFGWLQISLKSWPFTVDFAREMRNAMSFMDKEIEQETRKVLANRGEKESKVVVVQNVKEIKKIVEKFNGSAESNLKIFNHYAPHMVKDMLDGHAQMCSAVIDSFVKKGVERNQLEIALRNNMFKFCSENEEYQQHLLNPDTKKGQQVKENLMRSLNDKEVALVLKMIEKKVNNNTTFVSYTATNKDSNPSLHK